MAHISSPTNTISIPSVATPAASKRKWWILIVLSLALAIIILDTTILNVALSAIIKDLKTDIQSLQWVITAYSLTLSALTITGGRMGDIFGRKRMFVVGAFLFAVGSFLASISTNVGMLIAGEAIIEGIGAALMMPATASLLVANFFGRERAIAFGVWGGIAGAAAALGPILGGYLTTHYSWRWGFRVNLFVVFVLIIGSFIIPESRDTKEKPQLDFFGVLLSAVGLLGVVFGIIESSTYGWWKASQDFVVNGHILHIPWGLSVVPFCIVIGLIILVGFGFWQKYREDRGDTPLVSLSIFKNWTFTSGVLTTAIMSLGQTGLIFALPVFLQAVRGLNAFDTGLSLLPMSLALLVVAPLGAIFSKKIRPKYLINLGLLLNAVAYVVLWHTLNVDTVSTDLIPGLALFGIGMGLVFSQINNITLSAVPAHQAGEASGVNNTLRQIGATLGAAVIGAVLLSTLTSHMVSGVNASTIIPQQMKAGLLQNLSAQTSNVEFGGGAQLGGSIPQNIQQEILSIGHQATVEGNKQALVYGAIFALMGFLLSLFLPMAQVKKEEVVAPVAEAEAIKPVPARRLELDAALIGELIQADAARRAHGEASLGLEVRALIDAASMGGSITQSIDPRIVQARALWDAGWGTELGCISFAQYVKDIPSVPQELLASDVDFPYLVLVDSRVSVARACALLGISPKGNEETQNMPHLHVKGEVYWIRCQDGDRLQGKSVQEAEQNFGSNEQGLSAIEGIALIAQTPELLQSQYIDLPATSHQGFENSSACLGTWNGNPELRWRWRDHVDSRCSVASRKA